MIELFGLSGNWGWHFSRNEFIWSSGMYKLFGLDDGSIQPDYELFRSLVHPEDRAKLEDAGQILNEGILGGHTFRIIRPDGTMRMVLSRGDVYFTPDGAPAGAAGVILDITSQRRATLAVRVHNDRQRAVFEHGMIVPWVWTSDGQALHAPGWCELTGLPPRTCSATGTRRSRIATRSCAARGGPRAGQGLFAGIHRQGGERHPDRLPGADGAGLRARGPVREWTGLTFPPTSAALEPEAPAPRPRQRGPGARGCTCGPRAASSTGRSPTSRRRASSRSRPSGAWRRMRRVPSPAAAHCGRSTPAPGGHRLHIVEGTTLAPSPRMDVGGPAPPQNLPPTPTPPLALSDGVRPPEEEPLAARLRSRRAGCGAGRHPPHGSRRRPFLGRSRRRVGAVCSGLAVRIGRGGAHLAVRQGAAQGGRRPEIGGRHHAAAAAERLAAAERRRRQQGEQAGPRRDGPAPRGPMPTDERALIVGACVDMGA